MKARILVIEDNLPNLQLISYLLRTHGCEPFSATSAEEALEWLKEEENPHLILCDIQLPGMDGFEFARLLNADENRCNIPLVAVTALAMVGDREKVIAAGFNNYIGKPIEPEKFIDHVNTLLPPELQLRRLKLPEEAVPLPEKVVVSKGVILVVDDIASNIAVLRSVLQPSGYVTISATTVKEALLLLETNQPDLILADLHLPGQEDFDFIQSVKSITKISKIPFLYISSTGRKESLRAQGLKEGAMRFIFRPIHPIKLLSIIEECLAENQSEKTTKGDCL